MTHACAVEDNEPKSDGMLLPRDWNASPWPGHKAQFSAGPPRDLNAPFCNPPGDHFVGATHYISETV